MRYVVTNGHTELGAHVRAVLGSAYVFAPEHDAFDLSIETEVQRMYENAAAGDDTCVIHCTTNIGKKTPGRDFYAALVTNAFILEHAQWNKVGRYAAVFDSERDLTLVDAQRIQASLYKHQYGFEAELWFPELAGKKRVEEKLREYLHL